MLQNRSKKTFWYIICFVVFTSVTGILLFFTFIRHSGTNKSSDAKPYVDKFITALPVDLTQVASISKFRSCSGHDYTSANVEGQQEINRSMKHYINPLDSLVGTTNSIKIFAPFDGTVAAINADAASNIQVGLQVWLTPADSPAWSLIFYHITPLVKAGDLIKAGQLIGYANLSKTSVIDFDIALEAWVQNSVNPLGPGNLGDIHLALQREPNYLQLLHTGQLDSIFNHMTQEVLAEFASRGISQENIIVSKANRDASPCPQPTNNGHYQSSPSDNVLVK